MTSETILWIKNILVSGKSGLSSKIKHRKVDSCCIQRTPGEGKRAGVPLCNSGTSSKQCLWNKVPRIKKKNLIHVMWLIEKKQKGTAIIFEALLFLVYNYVTSRPCWCVNTIYNFFSKNFSSFRKVRFFAIVYCFEMFLWQQDALQCVWEKTNPI